MPREPVVDATACRGPRTFRVDEETRDAAADRAAAEIARCGRRWPSERSACAGCVSDKRFRLRRGTAVEVRRLVPNPRLVRQASMVVRLGGGERAPRCDARRRGASSRCSSSTASAGGAWSWLRKPQRSPRSRPSARASPSRRAGTVSRRAWRRRRPRRLPASTRARPSPRNRILRRGPGDRRRSLDGRPPRDGARGRAPGRRPRRSRSLEPVYAPEGGASPRRAAARARRMRTVAAVRSSRSIVRERRRSRGP